MSAFGCKADIAFCGISLSLSPLGVKRTWTQPFLTDLNLFVQVPQLSEAVGTRIDRMYLGPIVSLIPIAITAAQSAGDPCWNAAMPALAFLAVVGLALFVADATLTVLPICLAECK